MPEPSGTAWCSSASRSRFPGVFCVTAVAFVLAMVALRWNHDTGLTSLEQFGEDWASQRMPALKEVPISTVKKGGYDGQFYAQLAVQPNVNNPELQLALDNPAYRSRRILLPLTAHLLGGGNAQASLYIYALLNLVAWVVLAWVWWLEVQASTPQGAAVWLACLLSLGALDSVRLSLTDLPATLLLVGAVLAVRASRTGLAAACILAGGFVRETSVLAVDLFKPEGKWRTWGLRALCVLPVLGWCVWLRLNVPGDTGAQAFDWPGLGLLQHLRLCVQQLGAGNFDSRYLFGLLGALGLAYQSVFVLLRWREPDPWVRLGLPFAVLFWFLSAYVFSGYWAAARACLPLTFAFNRLLPRDGKFWPRLVLANLSVLHGVWRMLP